MEKIVIKSNDGVHNLNVLVWEPEGEVCGILQISHGMIEYVERYKDFAKFLNKNGWAVIGNDHLGHGDTAENPNDRGYFCKKNQSENLVKDLHKVTIYAKERFKNVPLVLMGHSFGSFLARRYYMTYGNELDGIIIAGTGSQPPMLLKFGKLLVKAIKLVKGERFRSSLLPKISFMGYNSRILNCDSPNAWLSKDHRVVEEYDADELCTFKFTLNGYYTLFDTIEYIQQEQNIDKLPMDVPTLIIAGEQDPVGKYGKDVKNIFKCYEQRGMENIKLKLYRNDRHELINETDKALVYSDILNWLIDNI